MNSLFVLVPTLITLLCLIPMLLLDGLEGRSDGLPPRARRGPPLWPDDRFQTPHGTRRGEVQRPETPPAWLKSGPTTVGPVGASSPSPSPPRMRVFSSVLWFLAAAHIAVQGYLVLPSIAPSRGEIGGDDWLDRLDV